jgi:hypothetical protein
LTRKTSRQLSAATSRPPSEGPTPAASAATAERSATACARRSAGKAWSTRPSEAGTMNAAPSAWRTRNPIRALAEGAIAQRTDAKVNSARPARKTRRRPSRSAIRPAATRNAAKTML